MSEITEETARELIEAINRLVTILKPQITEPAPEPDLTPQQLRQQQKMREKRKLQEWAEEAVRKSCKRQQENYAIQRRVSEEKEGRHRGTTEQYLSGLSHREQVYYDRLKRPYHLRGNGKSK